MKIGFFGKIFLCLKVSHDLTSLELFSSKSEIGSRHKWRFLHTGWSKFRPFKSFCFFFWGGLRLQLLKKCFHSWLYCKKVSFQICIENRFRLSAGSGIQISTRYNLLQRVHLWSMKWIFANCILYSSSFWRKSKSFTLVIFWKGQVLG